MWFRQRWAAEYRAVLAKFNVGDGVPHRTLHLLRKHGVSPRELEDLLWKVKMLGVAPTDLLDGR